MKKFTKALAAIMLFTLTVFFVGCKPEDEPNNGGGGTDQTDNHEYVDLGLPSGTLWATCNVGAETPEGCGNYYAWGETRPQGGMFNWSSYNYCNGNYHALTKYCPQAEYGFEGFTDNLTTLLPEDDAATANWGENWLTPTKTQWEELCQNTTMTLTVQNDVKGALFTASNGKSIFLPVTGYYWESELKVAGDYGIYWSSSYDMDNPSGAWGYCFGYFSSDVNGMDCYGRARGQVVRPVKR